MAPDLYSCMSLHTTDVPIMEGRKEGSTFADTRARPRPEKDKAKVTATLGIRVNAKAPSTELAFWNKNKNSRQKAQLAPSFGKVFNKAAAVVFPSCLVLCKLHPIFSSVCANIVVPAKTRSTDRSATAWS